MKLIRILPVIFLVSCSVETWTKKEQNEFLDGCIKEGGTNFYCRCFMESTMENFPRYKDSKKISFEEAVELSKNCN